MSNTLYLQLDQNIEVTNPHVYLQDIAALSMADAKKTQSSPCHAGNGPGSGQTRTLCNVCLRPSENDPKNRTFC